MHICAGTCANTHTHTQIHLRMHVRRHYETLLQKAQENEANTSEIVLKERIHTTLIYDTLR